MTSATDIENAKQAVLDALDGQLLAARAMNNQNVPGMAAKIQALEDKRMELMLQDYQDTMDSPTMTQALATLKSVTATMTATAAIMTTATAFLTHADTVIACATQAIGALKKA